MKKIFIMLFIFKAIVGSQTPTKRIQFNLDAQQELSPTKRQQPRGILSPKTHQDKNNNSWITPEELNKIQSINDARLKKKLEERRKEDGEETLKSTYDDECGELGDDSSAYQ